MAPRSKATAADLVELRAREILAGADSVLDTVTRLSPRLARPEHMRPVARFFADAAAGEPARLVLSSAPRFGKTTTFEHGIAWLMHVRPGVRVVVVCCTASLAEQISRRVRELAERAGVRIARDQRAADLWSTANGSSLRAIGAGGALVGVGADVLVCDDLIPSMEAAQSETQREQTEQWFETTALGRLEPGAAVLVCAHRWAVDDISGRLVARGWPLANIPALDPTTGASNWPARWSTADLRAKEAEVGPIAWAALYCGMPRPRGGTIFGAPPVFYDRDQVVAMLAAQTARVLIAVDPAATAKTSSDASVALVVAFYGRPGRDLAMFVLDMWRGQVLIPDLVDRLAAMQRRWRAPIAVESVGAFRAIPDMLKRINPGLAVAHVQARADKYTRIQPCAAAWARGDIRLPPEAPWLGAFLSEVQTATMTGSDMHDDVPDTLGIAWSCAALAGHADQRQRRVLAARDAMPFG